jgi:hypothetical protein
VYISLLDAAPDKKENFQSILFVLSVDVEVCVHHSIVPEFHIGWKSSMMLYSQTNAAATQAGVTALVVSVPVTVSATVASSSLPLFVSLPSGTTKASVTVFSSAGHTTSLAPVSPTLVPAAICTGVPISTLPASVSLALGLLPLALGCRVPHCAS